jgi:hypothetical protein
MPREAGYSPLPTPSLHRASQSDRAVQSPTRSQYHQLQPSQA